MRAGTDAFLSNDDKCEGKELIEYTGSVWSAPPASPNTQLLRCKTNGSGELFESLDPGCEGQTVDKPLGYVLTQP